MKSKVIVLSIFAAFSFSGLALAQDTAGSTAAAPDQAVEQAKTPAVAVGNTRCPVCGMDIPAEELGKYTAEYNGKSYNVCSPSDRDMFLSQPERYSKIADTGDDPYKQGVLPEGTVVPPVEQK